MSLSKWENIVDRLLRDSIGDGDISRLPGAGKRLKLEDESLTPPDLRAAHKIMQDNAVTPDWIAEGHRLDQLEASLRQQIHKRGTRYKQERTHASASGDSSRSIRAEKSWQQYVEDYLERVERYNRDALLYNLKAPQGIKHKQILKGKDLIRRSLQSQL